jgi:hypothetical protein
MDFTALRDVVTLHILRGPFFHTERAEDTEFLDFIREIYPKYRFILRGPLHFKYHKKKAIRFVRIAFFCTQ